MFGLRTEERWTAARAPEQHGRTAVVTGASSGIGLATAAALARLGAHVVLAVRDPDRGARAASRIREAVPGAGLTVQELDLAALDSVRRAAKELDGLPGIDLLVNNAGVMWTRGTTTAEGHELQFGVNHLGHFALTNLLLPRLAERPGSRVVTVSSHLHHLSRPGPPGAPAPTGRYRAYNHSKLANLLFTAELQRRLAASGHPAIATAAHPGLAATGLGRGFPAGLRVAGAPFARLLLQDADGGMLPTLRAATDRAARGGSYYGPGGITGTRGAPRLVRPGRGARDERAWRRLWEQSEELTGVTYGG